MSPLPPVSAHENKTIVRKSGRVVNVAGQGECRPIYATATFSGGNLTPYLDEYLIARHRDDQEEPRESL
jgi:hypothetical protein